jgi:hypothetical protein
MLKALLVKLVKGNWGRILPAILKAAADGHFGSAVQKAYVFMAGKKTVSGAIFLGLGAALETVCAAYPEFAWACPAARWVYLIGGVLAGVGLVDGGVRSPWPEITRGK